jgi:hypothetical protein
MSPSKRQCSGSDDKSPNAKRYSDGAADTSCVPAIYGVHSTVGTFYQFLTLPPEIRLMIWEETWPEPRVIASENSGPRGNRKHKGQMPGG